jgi:pyridoxine 5'-phosphate synthase PdxJ
MLGADESDELRLVELNIGHAVVSDAVFVGIEAAVAVYRASNARRG